ncbi:MAG: HAMP domain-containing histidine kinase [Candidatus Synoicihabitans palmerolidicus]|nr:HAMP domain-containing histidine kinase [Candidatus Synoicihabitans palmerolidicus]MCC5022136.1 HAMP domain-containing histidine kinase [Candidatus Synoicihabitans palmerolidicus]
MIEPLHEIIGCASVLEMNAELMSATDVKDFARTITTSAEILNRRFENFVLFTSLESGTLSASTGPAVSVDALIRHAAAATTRRHQRIQGLRLQLSPLTAPVARELLAKIVTELLDNACVYSIRTEPIDVSLSVDERHLQGQHHRLRQWHHPGNPDQYRRCHSPQWQLRHEPRSPSHCNPRRHLAPRKSPQTRPQYHPLLPPPSARDLRSNTRVLRATTPRL